MLLVVVVVANIVVNYIFFALLDQVSRGLFQVVRLSKCPHRVNQ